jgi:hypothetical protein
MDHHGLLTTLYAVNHACLQAHAARRATVKTWNWAASPVIRPETRCPFCETIVRSEGIWFLEQTIKDRLVGMLPLNQGQQVKIIQPGHPHDTGGGYLCLGKNATGVELLASTPNINDAPMGTWRIPKWLFDYWGHWCEPAALYLRAREVDYTQYRLALREYLTLRPS